MATTETQRESPLTATPRAAFLPSQHVSRIAAFERVEGVDMNRTELLTELDGAIAERNLLKHPFYQDWQAGTLSLERLRLYAKQYYLHVESFPIDLHLLAARAEGSLRELILENLADETDPVAPHPELWRDFAAAVGVSGESFWTVAPLSGVRKLVDNYGQICAEAPLEEAVAALYAYEAQVPEISTAKSEGLRRYYGVTTDKGLAYFKVHEEADRVHRAAWRGWFQNETSPGEKSEVDGEQILRTAEKALDALWGALDSIQQANVQ
jgi:pyrroloquinoline-quinone synthase